MCYNETTSAITFTISFICFIYLITRKNTFDIYSGWLTISIGLMQLVEFFLWRNQECNEINRVVSLCIIIVLYLECVVCSSFNYLNTKLKMISVCSIFIFTIFTIYLLNWLYNLPVLCSQPSKESCRLVWSPFEQLINTSMYSRVLLVIFLLFYFFYAILSSYILIKLYFNKYPIRVLLLPVTFIITLIYTFLVEGKNYIDIFGSMWCFLAVAYGIVSCLHI